MKKILSMMLVVMLVLSSVVAVSAAEEPFKVFEVKGETPYSFGTTFEGYLVISADVYVADGVSEAKIAAVANGEVVAEASIDTGKKDVWQKVKVELAPGSADGLKFTSVDGSIYVNNINVGRAKAKTLVYEEDFDDYEEGDSINGYNVYDRVGNSVDPDPTPVTSFKAVKNIDGHAGAATLFHPNYYYSYVQDGVTLETKRYNNDGTPDETAIKKGEKSYMENDPEAYAIDIPEVGDADHVILEFDAYNAANAFSPGTTTYDSTRTVSIMDTLMVTVGREKTDHWGNSELPRVMLQAGKLLTQQRTIDNKVTDDPADHKGSAKSWNKVVIDARKSTYVDETNGTTYFKVDYSVEYCGVKVKNTTHRAYADDFRSIIFGIDPNAGGRYYIDNVKYFVVDELEDIYVSRYNENFDDSVTGSTPEGFTLVDVKTTDTEKNYSTFTVEKNEAVSDSKYGRIYNGGYTTLGTKTRVSDDGLADNTASKAANSDTDSNTEWFELSLPGQTGEPGWGTTPQLGDVKKTRLTFKHYITDSVVEGGYPYECLEIGYARKGVSNLSGSESPRVKLHPRVVYMHQRKNKGASFDTDTNSDGKLDWNDYNTGYGVYKSVNFPRKAWIPVTIDIESTCVKESETDPRFNHVVTYSGQNITVTSEVQQAGYDINKLLIGMTPDLGGIAYIDDINVSTNFVASDFAALDIATVDLYDAGVELEEQTEDFVVKAVDFSQNEQSVTLSKKLYAADSVQVVTALYENNILKDAKVNTVDTSEFKAFNDNSAKLTELVEVKTVGNGYSYKVFVFNSADGLKPLADMFIKQ